MVFDNFPAARCRKLSSDNDPPWQIWCNQTCFPCVSSRCSSQTFSKLSGKLRQKLVCPRVRQVTRDHHALSMFESKFLWDHKALLEGCFHPALIQPYLHKERYFVRNIWKEQQCIQVLSRFRNNIYVFLRETLLQSHIFNFASVTQHKHSKVSSICLILFIYLKKRGAGHSFQMQHIPHLKRVSEVSECEELFSHLRKRRINCLLSFHSNA